MPLPTALVAELRRALRTFRAANGAVAVPSAPGRALEAWLTMRLAQAAHASGGWHVSLRRGDGSRLPTGDDFRFPTYQSRILPPDPDGPGHVLLVKSDDTRVRLEMHASLQWVGRSGATHECDVSVLPHEIAHRLRIVGGGHPHGLPVAAYECKDRPGTAPPDEMRQTVARLYDLALVTKAYPKWGCRIFEPSLPTPWGRWRSTYRAFFATGAFGVVRVGRFGFGGRVLADHYHVGRHGRIYTDPTAIDTVEKRFVATINRAGAI